MGRVFVVEVEGRSYRCRYCHTSLALTEDVLSRGSIKGALHHICNNLGLQCTILCALPTTSNAHAHTRTSTWEVPKSILALLVPLLLCHTSLYGTMSFSCNHGKAYLVHKVWLLHLFALLFSLMYFFSWRRRRLVCSLNDIIDS
ncbi:uncharacterized protein LOC114307094 isoform X2 [Camellia sinensis]|uniref:uncharacterized protein LOC114307094 isoform X2 n=1 Tax=Camellia sinensis TaxID=4442 RepID=UPI001035E6C5|nr:uncharacterized protein LOC114307094 isoform X2 [Camellia sinensis]